MGGDSEENLKKGMGDKASWESEREKESLKGNVLFLHG